MLAVGVAAMALSLSVGTVIGVLSGFFRRLDGPLMRFTDLFLALPVLPLLMVTTMLFREPLRAALGLEAGIFILVVGVIGITSWMQTARIVRGQVLAIRAREYVTAARSIGARPWRIIGRHVFPNALSPIVVAATLDIAAAIITESALSFLGLGFPSDFPTWGRLLYDGVPFLTLTPDRVIWPGLAISLTVLSVNFLGDGLRDALDPTPPSPPAARARPGDASNLAGCERGKRYAGHCSMVYPLDGTDANIRGLANWIGGAMERSYTDRRQSERRLPRRRGHASARSIAACDPTVRPRTLAESSVVATPASMPETGLLDCRLKHPISPVEPTCLPSQVAPLGSTANTGARRASVGSPRGVAVALSMAQPVVRFTTEPEICRFRAAAERERHDVVDLQPIAGAAAPPAVAVDIAATTLVAAPHLSAHGRRDVP